MIHNSLWTDFKSPRFATSTPESKYDVAIIGAGIFGLTAALLLKQAGKKVCVLERDRVASGQTALTSAHLTCMTDEPLSVLCRRFGEAEAVAIWRAGLNAIDFIERTAKENKIDCDFARVPGFQYSALTSTENGSAAISKEAEFVKARGFDIAFVANGPIQSRPAMRLDNQALFHPRKYLAGVAELVNGDGSVVCEQMQVEKVDGETSNSLKLTLGNKQHLECAYVVDATHVPIVGKASLLDATLFQTKLFLYSSYVLGARISPSTITPGLYCDTSNPYYYLRVHQDGDEHYAIFGGNDHKTGQGDSVASFSDLSRTFEMLFPNTEIERRWTGQVVETADGLPYIGEASSGQFIATGFAGNGLTFGTIAGQMARDAVTGAQHELADLLHPSRKSLTTGLKNIVAENIDYPVHLIADRIKSHVHGNPEELKAGEGNVYYIDGHQIACHRDERGQLQMVSATCTHLGCVVKWNKADRTWDCPCHGSRFASDGTLMGGPAETPLQPFNRD